eukprot:COSAG05_NODE_3817_length_1822_cov_1.278003_1_plen_293_part_00
MCAFRGGFSYYNNLWHKFAEIDSDGDRRLSAEDFTKACAVVGVTGLSPDDVREEFHYLCQLQSADDADAMAATHIRFRDFCMWCARRHVAILPNEEADEPEQPAPAIEPPTRPASSGQSGSATKTQGAGSGKIGAAAGPGGGGLSRNRSPAREAAQEQAARDRQKAATWRQKRRLDVITPPPAVGAIRTAGPGGAASVRISPSLGRPTHRARSHLYGSPQKQQTPAAVRDLAGGSSSRRVFAATAVSMAGSRRAPIAAVAPTSPQVRHIPPYPPRIPTICLANMRCLLALWR